MLLFVVHNLSMSRIQLPRSSSERAKYAYKQLISLEMKPNLTAKCPHKITRYMNVCLGERDPDCAMDISVQVDCKKCGRAPEIVNNPTAAQRQRFLAGLAMYDKAKKEMCATLKRKRGPSSESESEDAPTASKAKSKAISKGKSREVGDNDAPTTRQKKPVRRHKPKRTTEDSSEDESEDLPTGSKGKEKAPVRKHVKASTSVNVADEDVMPPKKRKLNPPDPAPEDSFTDQEEDEEEEIPLIDLDLYLFTVAHETAVHETIHVRDIERVMLSECRSFVYSLCNSTNGDPTISYERYSPVQKKFTDACLREVRNFSQSGTTVIYRRRGLTDDECPRLAELIYDVDWMASHRGGLTTSSPIRADTTAPPKRVVSGAGCTTYRNAKAGPSRL
ncbi:hypothetical protein R3P38DRAFT_3081742 [Favolaschia claudopus]|uniref:Uncharacterized protein n=1 Tax=Favolaschia claudopus TaxID=2862362 RepID=A0AAV9ZVC0_9AGAR